MYNLCIASDLNWEGNFMKYLKPEIKVIDLNDDDIILTSDELPVKPF